MLSLASGLCPVKDVWYILDGSDMLNTRGHKEKPCSYFMATRFFFGEQLSFPVPRVLMWP